MGYTHYWHGQRAFTDAEWRDICADASKLLTDAPVHVVREYDEPGTRPHIGDDCIAFNGFSENGHETFWLAKEPEGFQFCKTAHKPYDVLVTAMLMVAERHAPGAIRISSDGDADDWELGLQLVRDRCGDGYANPFRANDL